MPEVPGSPYEPYPTVEPQVEFLRPGGLPDVPAAFGAPTARAISTFGGDVQQAGKEVFDRALALRRLQIEGDTRDIATDWSNRMEGVKNAFTVKQGYAAGPDAMNETLAQINQERMAARAQVIAKWGPYGGQLFDDQTASMQRSFTREVGGWSAQQFRKGQKDSVDARIALAENRAQSNPYDDEAFNAGVAELRGAPGRAGLLAQRASLLDLDPDSAKVDADTAIARLTQRRIIGFAIRNDQERAQATFDQAVKDKTISGDVADATQKAMQTQLERNVSIARTAQRFNDQQTDRQAQTAVAQTAARNVTTDPQTGEVLINPRLYTELANLAQQNPQAQKYAQERITWAQRQQDRADKGIVVRTNPDTMSGLTQNMFDSSRPTSERDVVIAETNGQLSHKDGTWLRTMIKARDQGDADALKDPRFKLADDTAKKWILGTGVNQQYNVGNYAAFQGTFLSAYLNKVRENKLESDDLDIKNPNGLLRKTLDTYAPGIGETIRNNGGVGGPPTVPATAPTPTPPAPAGVPIVINSKAEYDALDPNTPFTYHGKKFNKPAGATP
jgi:hypothetical protein